MIYVLQEKMKRGILSEEQQKGEKWVKATETFAIACERTGRHYICGDINPNYAVTAIQRLQEEC